MSYWTDDIGGMVLKQKVHLEDDGKHNAVIQTTQDCTPILEENAAFARERQGRLSPHGTAVAARVPHIFYYVLWPQEFKARHGYHPKRGPFRDAGHKQEAEQAWRDFMIGKLNDPDFGKFRTDDSRKRLADVGRQW